MCTIAIACPQICWDLNLYRNRLLLYIICTKDKFFELRFINVQQQCGSCDCALFAITNSTALCLGEDPHWIRYDQKQMRQRLKECFEAGAMQLFPEHKTAPRVKRQRVCGRVTVAVYCLCSKYTHMPATRYSVARVKSGIMITASQTLDSSQTWICHACTTHP